MSGIEKTGRMPRINNTILEATGTFEVVKYLTHRHRVGLLETTIVVLLTYIISDIMVSVFN